MYTRFYRSITRWKIDDQVDDSITRLIYAVEKPRVIPIMLIIS